METLNMSRVFEWLEFVAYSKNYDLKCRTTTVMSLYHNFKKQGFFSA